MTLRQQLSSMLTRRLLQQHAAAGLLPAAASVAGWTQARSLSAVPQHADSDDELVAKASRALEEIKAAGTLKVERQITTPQAASVGEHRAPSWQTPIPHATHTRSAAPSQQHLSLSL
jgi:hypothetical protein